MVYSAHFENIWNGDIYISELFEKKKSYSISMEAYTGYNKMNVASKSNNLFLCSLYLYIYILRSKIGNGMGDRR